MIGAKDYVEMQWLMLQQDQPDDFVIATGLQYSVRDFVNFAYEHLGKNFENVDIQCKVETFLPIFDDFTYNFYFFRAPEADSNNNRRRRFTE